MMYGKDLSLFLRLLILVSLFPTSRYGFAKSRDLAGFDSFGPYTIPLAINARNQKESTRIMVDLRRFIWSHWHERRLGYAVVTDISLEESVPCTTRYFIEQDNDGRWHIEQQCKCTKGRPKTETSIITAVRRLAIDASGYRTRAAIPDDSEVPPESFVLEFRNSLGGFEGYR